VILVVAATERELDYVEGAEHLVCGIGPVEAAITTARALEARRPDAVLHVGLAGARTFAQVEAVIGDESVYADTAARTIVPSRTRPDADLLAAARRALPDARVCAIATSARVGGGGGYEIEAMEGFSVLRACELAAVPAVEVRVVVNAVDEPDRERWRFDDGFALLHEIVPNLIGELDRA
jgi:predicted 5'-methylthioadenosine/S-adenosylhomocysteine nucleosidase